MAQVEELAHDAAGYTKTYWETPAETETRFRAVLIDPVKTTVMSAYRAATRAYETLTGQPTNKLVPVLTSLNPNTAVQGSAGFVLTANGSNFATGAQINWAGQYLKTTFVSNTQLRADIPASLVQAAATVPVKIYVDTDVSATVNFTITATREAKTEKKKSKK